MQQQNSFGAAELTKLEFNRNGYRMIIKQQPSEGQVLAPQKHASARKPQTERRCLDPPVVIEFLVIDNDPSRSWLHSPHYFCLVQLVRLDGKPSKSNLLIGTLTSSLHVVKLNDGKSHGYFVFSDLFPTCEGKFCLQFTLFEMRSGPDAMFAEMLNSISGSVFEVHACKKFSPLPQSTDLTRALSDGGVKIRVRKEPVRRMQRNRANWGFQGYLDGYRQAVPASVYGQPQPYPHHGLEHWGQQGNFAYNTNNAIDIRERLSVQHHGMAPTWQGGGHQSATLPLPSSMPAQPLHRYQHGVFLHDMQQPPVSQSLPPLTPLLLNETQQMLMPPPPPPLQPQHRQQQQQPSFASFPQILPQHFNPLPPASYNVRDDAEVQLEYPTTSENQTFDTTTSADTMPCFTAADDQIAYPTSSEAQLIYSTTLEDHMVPTSSPGTDSTYVTSTSSVDQQQYQQSALHGPGTYHVQGPGNLQNTYDPNSSIEELL
ncbi:uncharacterized protein Z520_07302 [Fonsecaea multimorphosa CBS 102226]|uniref:Velvet domain-containing protein n=1 Tax=Fonsecaea multimorphosa CBS 102226 TaxID=1442371 RepID=A0A0D2KKN0_9EURO|nr:uncharacterized protein Z520_07302 [Fonsecaea multimorphosa CBS 102226]KIX97188.1 hypothetical protein Z520_07302 [Fonsecaea multimorphosa CBS 102226]